MPITETPPGLGSGISPQQWVAFVLEHMSAQSVVLASGATRVDTPHRIVHIQRVKTDGSETGQRYWQAQERQAETGKPRKRTH
jgi:hypothetical protein